MKNYNLKNHLFLFDIDGTILDTKGDGRKAFVEAFKILLDKEITEKINFLGGIDKVIFKKYYDYFELNKKDFDIKWSAFKNEYLKILDKLSLNCQWRLFKNADNVIKNLYKYSNIGLVTGNIEKGAMIKLKKFGLDNLFSCGGFGDSVITRDELVKEAIKSCNIYHNKKFDNTKIYLFGDTQIDIDSAHANNIIPVLIDPQEKFKDHKKDELSVKYHGTFEYIEIFLHEININSPRKEILYFC